MLGNRMLGGVSFLPFLAPETGAGAGGGDAGGGAAKPDAGAAAAASAAAAGAGGDQGKAAAAAGTDAGKGAATTLAGGDQAAAAAAAAAPATFPEKWREQLAGEDKDALTDLAKYTDPKALYKSLRELQTKISKGELKAAPKPLPDNATDEQKAEWRKANGLPETATGYVEKVALPDGVVIGEADKALVGNFAEMAHAKGWSQDQFNQAVGWFYEAQDLAKEQLEAGDSDHKTAAATALAAEWGAADFKVNMNAMQALTASMPEDIRASVLAARTPDGQLLGNTPGFIKWAASFMREMNPSATVVPANTPDVAKTIADEISTIEGKMYTADGKENPEYWKGDSGARMQARLRELYDAQAKQKGKAA